MKPAFQLSGSEFVKSVLDLKPKVAVFDCDGTLWDGDSGEAFFYWESERGLIAPHVIDWALSRYRDYKAGQVDEKTMCGEMVTIHAGIPEAKLRAEAEKFFREKMAMGIFPQMQELVMELASTNCDIWAVSSTNDWVVRAGVRRFGICDEHVLAACVALDNRCASDRLLRVPTDESKADVIREYVPGGRPDVAFGNSIHDIAMLEMAGHPFAIQPDKALAKLARQRGWTIYHPRVID